MGTLTPEYRWLLPGMLTSADPESRPMRRSTRDWSVDVLCFALGLGFTVLVTWDLHQTQPVVVPGWSGTASWVIWADFAAGTLAALSLWWRRRWPVGIALGMIPVGIFSLSGAVSALIVTFTVAVHRRIGTVALVAGVSFLLNAAFAAVRPERGMAYWESVGWSVAFVLIVILWGMVVRARRQLLVSLRDRAERAESEQYLRVAQARTLERTRIAREMHDVLAHRISLLSLHAGALEIRPDASSEEVAGAAGVIRASAHQALQDLREVIGVLRETDGAGDGTPERPQPTLAELPQLIGESQAAGTRVRLESDVDPGAVPDAIGRAAYRIVQEGLTNARKHAPGAVVTVTASGAPRTGLTLEIRNSITGRPDLGIPGTGTGLVGLAERATLAGGRLSHQRLASGEFVLSAWLPWPRA